MFSYKARIFRWLRQYLLHYFGRVRVCHLGTSGLLISQTISLPIRWALSTQKAAPRDSGLECPRLGRQALQRASVHLAPVFRRRLVSGASIPFSTSDRSRKICHNNSVTYYYKSAFRLYEPSPLFCVSEQNEPCRFSINSCRNRMNCVSYQDEFSCRNRMNCVSEQNEISPQNHCKIMR